MSRDNAKNKFNIKLMSRTDKVAILLISLGEDLASELLQKLPAAEAKRVLQAISGMKNLDAECIDAVQEEFQSLLVSFKARSPDGGETARRIISKTFDADDAAKFNSTLAPPLPPCFEEAETVDGKTLWQILQIEHPQTIALILGHLSAKKSGEIASQMPPGIRADILSRLANLREIDASVLDDIDAVLSKAIEAAKIRNVKRIGGPRKMAQILAQMGAPQRKEILENLEGSAPTLAAEVRSGLFTFDDIQKFDKQGIEKLLSVVSPADLELALRRVNGPLELAIFSAMSERRAAQLKENIAAAKPTAVSKIEFAQQKIAAIASELLESGDIRNPLDEVV